MGSRVSSILRAGAVPLVIVGIFLAMEIVTRILLFGVDGVVHPMRVNPRPITLTSITIANADPVLNYRLNPGLASYFKGREFSVNDAGFRGPPLATAKPPETFRIASLGASITMGAGVADRDVYSAQLEAMLNERLHRGFEVINASVGGYSARQIVDMYDQQVARFHPDLILFPVFYSGYQSLDDPVPSSYPPYSSFAPAWNDLRGYFVDSFFYQGLREAARKWLTTHLAWDWTIRGRPAPPDAPTPESTAAVLSRFVAQRHAQAIPVCLLVLHRISEDPPETDPAARQRLLTWVDANPGSCLIDTMPGLRGKVDAADRIYWGDNHPNPRVHRLYADEIFKALSAAKLLPGTAAP